jgi:ABC-2 type transport system permease protein
LDEPGTEIGEVPADLVARSARGFAFNPRTIGRINWLGAWTLYTKEVERFLKVALQSVVAPVVTTLLCLAVFSLAFGSRGGPTGGVSFPQFLAPGLIMMAIIQNSFANGSTSLLVSKIQGNIVDVLMPPLGAGELAACYTLAAVTRGVICAVTVFAGMFFFVDLPLHSLAAVLFYGLGASLILAQVGVIAGIWSEKFDHMSAVTNFVITPLAFLSGTFYSVERLPETWRALSHANPFFYLIDGFRYGFIGHADGNLAVGVSLIVLLNLILAVCVHTILKSGWRLKT